MRNVSADEKAIGYEGEDLNLASEVNEVVQEIDFAGSEAEKSAVNSEISELKEFIKSNIQIEDFKSGEWFGHLLKHALDTYQKKVDWAYFQEKYEGIPADVIVAERIKMASRYAAVGGGLTATAYTSVVAATIGTRGKASPYAKPAAITSFLVDTMYLSQLQLRLAFDISVLYRVPLDLSDPDDLWKLVKVAFLIKVGESSSQILTKGTPRVVTKIIKRFYSKELLKAAKSIPVIGKHLLQRNAIKFAIPAVGIPLSVVVNKYSTEHVGKNAQNIFRNEARIIQVAKNLTTNTNHPELLLWTSWLVVFANESRSDDEVLLMSHLSRTIRQEHQIDMKQFENILNFDSNQAWERLEIEATNLDEILVAATAVAEIDADLNPQEQDVIDRLTRIVKGNT